MKLHTRIWISAVYLLAALAITIQLTAQDNSAPKPKHHQYQLYDVGTFGGPNSYGSFQAISLTSAGGIGTSDLAIPDPFFPYCLVDCFVSHAVLWQGGVVTDLGALAGNNGGNSSYAYAINNAGLVAGISENGTTDPATGYPEVNAVVWKDGNIMNLGTFGGTQSSAAMLNNRGQVIGSALNDVPDPFSFGSTFPGTTQAHAFLWERGVKQDLGTLGGPDSIAYEISQSGKVAGWSYVNYVPNPTTGVPTVDPFLWDNGKMTDLGNFGGATSGVWYVNNKGQVVGLAYLPGDLMWHGFFWNGALVDTGSLGGRGAYLGWVNESGVAVGGSFLADEQSVHTTLWSKGTLSDIGTVGQDTCAQAYAINSSQQAVGTSAPNCSVFGVGGRAFLWEKGGPMVDLNALIENPSDLHVYYPLDITDSGQIIGQAVTPTGNVRLVVLIPDGDCGSGCEQRIAEFENSTITPVRPSGNVPAQLGGVPGMGRFNPFARLLEAHRPNANPAQPK